MGDTTEEEFKPDLDKLPEGLKTYLRGRVFNYLHHFSGAEDKLGRAIEQSASLLGMVVRVESCDLKAGVDLATDTPYRAQLKKAKAGGYDGYRSGFPCSTFSRARFNPVEGAPGPLRTQDHPYGLPDLDDKGKEEVRLGTVFLARSVEMAGAVMFTENDSGITPPVSLENPPPSEVKRHLSAWELPGFAEYSLEQGRSKWAAFPTCLYQRDREAGTRNFKPQRFLGSIEGLGKLTGQCPCGRAGHRHINLGNSAAAAAYPDQLVDALAEKIVAHLFKMGHLEWLKQRQVELQTEIRDLSRTASSSKPAAQQPVKPPEADNEAVMESRVDTLLQMGAIAKERRQKLVEAAAKAKAEVKARSDHKDSGGATAQSGGSAQHPAQDTDAEQGGATATEKTGTTKAKKKVVKYPIKTKSKAAGAPPGASSAALASAAPPPTAQRQRTQGADLRWGWLRLL